MPGRARSRVGLPGGVEEFFTRDEAEKWIRDRMALRDPGVSWVCGLEVFVNVGKSSAIIPKVASMGASVRFYRDVLGMELLYGGDKAGFASR